MRRWVVAVLCILTLAACGDNSSSTGDNPFQPGSNTNNPGDPGVPVTPPDQGGTENPTDPRLARISLAASQYTVKSDNSDTATLTVTALDQDNAALEGVLVSIQASAGLLNTAKITTGANGTAAFTFQAGPERTNQVATVTVASGEMVKTVPILITGTTVGLDVSKTSVLQHDSQGIALSGQVLDAAGKPIYGEEITLSSKLGNTLSAADKSGPSIVLTTDVSGKFRATFSGDVIGADTISLNGCGVQKDVTLTVKDSNFSFVPPEETSVPEGSTVNLLFQWEDESGPVSGKAITFAASHGHFEGEAESSPGMIQATTDTQGQATVHYIASDLATPATIQVFNTPGAGEEMREDFLYLNVLTVNTSRLDVQAFPTVIPPSIGDTASTSTIIATVRDDSNNPVKDALVNFQLLAGPGAGETIFPVSAYTDASGQAMTTFTAGSLTSAQNGIRLRAVANGFSDDVEITIGQKAARVVIGTTNQMEVIEQDGMEVAYGMPVTVLVTDNNGNPIPDQRVNLGIYPLRFKTGYWVRITERRSWVTTRPIVNRSLPGSLPMRI